MRRIKRLTIIFGFFLLAAFVSPYFCYGELSHIDQDKDRWKPYYRDVSPKDTVTRWLVPFNTKNRNDLKTVAVISTFGAHRNSYVRGHIHAGIDLVPRKRGKPYTYVLAMAPGVVCSIHLGDPHQTVVVKHKLESGETIFSSYKHMQEIYVETGQEVTHQTKIGRLYTRKEALKLGGNYDHLHLEIRKKFDDFGVASWATLTKKDLNLRFTDPWKFMKKHIKLKLSRLVIINPCMEKTNLSLVEPVVKMVKKMTRCKISVLHYKEATRERLKAFAPKAVIITGQYSPWHLYDKTALQPVQWFLKHTRKPVLGICGGHQLIALAFSGRVALIKGQGQPASYDNCYRIKGEVNTRILKRDPLLKGIGSSARFYSSHCEEVKTLPNHFERLISHAESPNYMIKHKTRKIYGVQFHPEFSQTSRGNGYTLLNNFLKQCDF